MTVWSQSPAPNAPLHLAYAYSGTKPVRGLGRALEALFGLYLFANVAFIFPVWHEITLLNRIAGDRASVTLDEAHRADDRVHMVWLLVLACYAAVIIVWLVWFYRMRTNVEAWSTRYERRAPGWAIGAWFCPIVNYWFPYQIARDVLDDTEIDLRRTYIRPSRPLLMIWWLGFVAMSLFDLVVVRHADSTLADLRQREAFVLAEIIVRLVVCGLAIAVVRSMTAAQTDRRARAYAALQATATASGT